MPIMKTNTGTGGTDNTPPTAQRQSQQHQNKSIIQECLNNAQYIYETKGDVASAFEMLQKMSSSSSTLVEERDMPLPSPSMLSVDMNHNLALMAYLSCTSAPNNDTNTNEENKLPHYSEDKFQNQLEEMYAKENETLLEGNDDEGQGGTSIENHCLQADDDSQLLSSTSMRKLVLGHNLALNYAITNRLDEGVSVLLPLFRAFRKDESKNSINTNFELDDVMSNISFLLLDCIFASCYKVDLFNEILTFIDSLVLKAVADNRGEAFCSSLKFRQHCYKSKGLFLQCKFEQATIREVNIRVAKKELKNAMEIYHHKLAKDLGNSVERSRGESVTLDEGGSVQESVTPSLGSISNDPMQYAGSAHLIQHSDSGISNGADNHDQFRMKRRHRQNQCALYLKANLEHLKSNTKKSLKLCSEAQHCGVRQRETSLIQERQNVYEESKRSLDNQAAYHYNNLAIIHQAAGKFHLAMHYYSMSIAHVENIEKHGLLMFVENDGIVNPIPSPQILFNASICGQQIENYSTAHECMKRCIAASPHSFACDPFCWLHMGESCINSHVKLKRKSRSVANTCENELDSNVSCLSLLRGIDCLNRCVILCSANDERHKRYLESATVFLAYSWLEQNNPLQVINLADSLLKEESLSSESNQFSVQSRRRRATMRMYACEAFSMLGMADKGLRYLRDDNDSNSPSDEHTHLLASHLASVVQSKKKQLSQSEFKRLNNAKAAVQLSSSMSYLSLGNVDMAQNKARSACSFTSHSNAPVDQTYLSAQSVLVQSLICGGSVSEALEVAKTLK